MVDISSQNNKINITVSSSGNTANTNVTPDYAQYYSEKSKEWAISNRIVDNTDYSSKYYANESKKQADISTAKTTEVVESGNNAVSNIESARDSAIIDVNTAGATQVALATEQATIATNKTSEVVASGNEALANIDTAKNNAITSITNQETTSKTSLIDEGATQIGLIQNEGATQVANVQSTGFYMRDDKLYFINSQGEETEFKSGGSGLEVCDIGMALYVDETKGLRRYLNGQIVDINTNTQAFLNRLKQITTLYPSLLCTEEEWQTAKTMSAFGQVGKFVFNYNGDEIVSVRLPRVVNVQGLFDLQNLGMTVGQALPSHTHTRGTMNITGTINIPLWTNRGTSGAFYEKSSGGVFDYGSNSGGYTAGFDANRAWAGNTSAPNYAQTVNDGAVQQEAIQYPYFIQIATGQETENNIVNEIELNNPYSFGDSKYSPVALNNLSWLKSEGQNNPKGTYPSFYDWILENVNKGTENFKLTPNSPIYQFKGNTTDTEGYTPSFTTRNPIVGSVCYGGIPILPIGEVVEINSDGSLHCYRRDTKDYIDLVFKQELLLGDGWITDYDFVINTTNETFRLPIKNGSESLPSDSFTNLTFSASGSEYIVPVNSYFKLDMQVTEQNATIWGEGLDKNGNQVWFDGAHATSGNIQWCSPIVPAGGCCRIFYQELGAITSFGYFETTGNGSLYYYVGETVQNAPLIDAGRIGEILPTKLDASKVKAYIVETYQNGNSWYRLWSDNWCEQGGLQSFQGTPYGLQTVTLLKPYIDTNYTVTANIVWGTEWFTNTSNTPNLASTTDVIGNITNRTKSSFDIQRVSSHFWKAEGYIA